MFLFADGGTITSWRRGISNSLDGVLAEEMYTRNSLCLYTHAVGCTLVLDAVVGVGGQSRLYLHGGKEGTHEENGLEGELEGAEYGARCVEQGLDGVAVECQ